MKDLIQSPPHSRESEMMVLGSAIFGLQGLKTVCEGLHQEDFYFEEHQMLFCVLKEMYQRQSPIDVHLFSEELKRQNILSKIGGTAYIIALVQFPGTSAHVEDYVEEVNRLSVLRKIALRSRRTENRALGGKENPELLLEDLKEDVKNLEKSFNRKLPFFTSRERIEREETFLHLNKGKKYLGLRTRFIEEFNEHLLGLRGLNLLAAAPNTGKTALTIQLGIDAVLMEADACLVYVSLEMSSDEIFRRMILSLAEIDYRTFVFGAWDEAHKEKIMQAKQTLCSLNERIQIFDSSTSPHLDAKTIIEYVESLKRKTSCQRAIVVIDYLQVWPISSKVVCFNENELDKWRIGEMKKLKDALSPDPIIVISEARKPSMKETVWGGDLSDVMGSARATYTPDVVMLLVQLRARNLKMLWDDNKMPQPRGDEIGESEQEKEGLRIKQFFESQGISICRLEVPKARDGMKKFSLLLEFHFQKNRFKKLDLEGMRKCAELSIPKDRWSSQILQKKGSNKSFAQMFVES
jgi:replicative DNA helicase